MTNRLWEELWSGDEGLEWWRKPAPEVLELVSSYTPETHPAVLDLGCGVGRHAIALAQAGFRVTATDSAPSAIERLKEWAERAGVSVNTKVCPMAEQGLPDRSFDMVLAYNVIYHGYREQFAQAITHASSLIRPCGVFFFTSPSREDAKYGCGERVAPHTYLSPNSVTPGDMHYFPDEDDFRELLETSRF